MHSKNRELWYLTNERRLEIPNTHTRLLSSIEYEGEYYNQMTLT